MAWTAPRTWAFGELVTVALMNEQVRDNEIVLRAGGIAIASQAAQDLIFASSTTQFGRLALGASRRFLRSNNAASAIEYASYGLPNALGSARRMLRVNNAGTDSEFSSWGPPDALGSARRPLRVNNAGTDTEFASWGPPDVIGTAFFGLRTNSGATDTEWYGPWRPRITSVASASSITPDPNTQDIYDVSALAANLTIQNWSGIVAGEKIMVRIKDNGSARTLAYGTSYSGAFIPLPTTTVAGKRLYMLFHHHESVAFYLIAVAQEA